MTSLSPTTPSAECGELAKLLNSTDVNLLTKLVIYSARFAEDAGYAIKKIYTSGNLEVVNKDTVGSKDDFQTEADRTAQQIIVTSFKHVFSDKLTVVAEEDLAPTRLSELKPWLTWLFKADEPTHPSTTKPSCLCLPDISSTKSSPQLWCAQMLGGAMEVENKLQEELRQARIEDIVIWVDPLDGTTEYVKALENPMLLEQITVLIGIAHKGVPVAGIIHQPFYKIVNDKIDSAETRTIWGVVGVDVFGGLTVVDEKMKAELVAVTSASHFTPKVDSALNELQRHGLIRKVERVGGAGHKVLRCLEGAVAYVYASAGCKKWDTAGPEAVLRAAGGQLTDISGRQITYASDVQHMNSGGVLATAPWVTHERYVSAIPDGVKCSLVEFETKTST